MKPRVLLVDDDPDMLVLLKRAALRCDLFSDVQLLDDARSALDLLTGGAEDARPHLIITDLKMPGLTGIQFIRELKDNPRIQHLPVAVLTSSEMPEDEKASWDAGACGYYVKPGSMLDLEQIFRSVLMTNAFLAPKLPPE